MKLTKIQLSFISSCYSEEFHDKDSVCSCDKSEIRTACSLQKRGIIIMSPRDREGDFTAHLTNKGLIVAAFGGPPVKLRLCPSCGSDAYYTPETSNDISAVSCDTCPLECSRIGMSLLELADIWNNLPRRERS